MKKESFTDELNKLFEKFVEKKNEGIKEAESFRKDVLARIDKKIDELNLKRDFFAEISLRKEQLLAYKKGVWKRICENSFWMNLRYLISMPFIYVVIIPVVILHIFVEIYHQVCFRLYDIPRVQYKEYFVFDRRHLPYLNWLEKINCAYCSYFNCFISYVREIAARTERYWCPIKHAKKRVSPHSQYHCFVDYSDGETLRKEWGKLREFSELRKDSNNAKKDAKTRLSSKTATKKTVKKSSKNLTKRSSKKRT